MILSIHLVPSASRDEVVGWHNGALKIRIAAPPVDNEANTSLVRFLAKKLDLSTSEITMESGHTSKRKRLRIPLAEEDVKAALS